MLLFCLDLLWVISPGLGGVLGPVGRGKGDYRKTNMLQGDNSDKERGKFLSTSLEPSIYLKVLLSLPS